MQTIKFTDGYLVTIDDRGLVSRSHQGKQCSAHASWWKDVPPSGPAADYIRKAGNRIEDYLFAQPGIQGMIIRATNGVREAVAAAAEKSKREQQEQDAKLKSEREALLASELSKCGLSDPVQIEVRYFDGYPTEVVHSERVFSNPDWKQVYCGQFAFIERTELNRLNASFDAAAKARAEREAAAKAGKDAKFKAKLAEAISTGKPVILSRWTTDRCMNHHANECSFDNAIRWLHPDGTTKVTYTCCY